MPRGRNATLTRALALLRLLEGRRRWTLAALSERLGVCERTIRRDLEALEAAGVPIGHEAVGPGRWLRGWWWLA
jgi:predicted DNA-binding transcriptional regulator YafY